VAGISQQPPGHRHLRRLEVAIRERNEDPAAHDPSVDEGLEPDERR
jgi:hypothetical protein